MYICVYMYINMYILLFYDTQTKKDKLLMYKWVGKKFKFKIINNKI